MPIDFDFSQCQYFFMSPSHLTTHLHAVLRVLYFIIFRFSILRVEMMGERVSSLNCPWNFKCFSRCHRELGDSLVCSSNG